MRPAVGSEPHAERSRKSSVTETSPHAAGPSGPTTFFLRTEEEMERSMVQSVSRSRESTYGVQSLEDALGSMVEDKSTEDDHELGGEAEMDKHNASGMKRRLSKNAEASPHANHGESKQQDSTASSPGRTAAARTGSPTFVRRPSHPTLSQPLTPLRLESPMPTSAMPSTPKSVSMRSFRLSDEESTLDDTGSQAIISSGEEDDEEKGETEETSSSFPELVMPSIQMPRRRPFTTAGKNMGRLKVLVAGQAGVGKTALIRSIVQVCQDIVHVDPLSPTVPEFHTSLPSKSKLRKSKSEKVRTTKVAEIHASTKAYPSWWSEMEDSRILRRRKSLNDTVLERNLCFIDTPGFRKSASLAEDTDHIVEYMEALLHRNLSLGVINDTDLLGLLSGGGGVHVDVVLYLFSGDNHSKDIDYCRRLSSLTNVIPLIGKADMLSPDQIISLKSRILSSLETSSIKPFLFGKTADEVQLKLSANQAVGAEPENMESTQTLDCIPPFAVSSKPSSDVDTMDASLLMSPDYVQPLVASELHALVAQVFNPDSMAWLRHSAAKKIIQWRNRFRLPTDSMLMHNVAYPQRGASGTNSANASVRDPLGARSGSPMSAASSFLSSASPSQVLVPRGQSSFYSMPVSSSASVINENLSSTLQPSDYAIARLQDHTQAEERYAQVELAKWAADLQRSLRNERERFEQLERSKRAQWLLERVGEEVKGGRIMPALPVSSESPTTEKNWAVVRRGTMPNNGGWTAIRPGVDPRDPLGLCDLGDGMRKKSVMVLRVLGGVGVVGAVMVAIVRVFGAESEVAGWWEWMTGSGSST